MRKSIFLLFFILVLLLLPVNAQAQTAITLENLTIQLWPDYDQPRVLVIYDFSLEANTALPASVNFQLPVNADLLAVAKNDTDGLLTVEHTLSSDGRMVAFAITEKTGYHLEYYMPYTSKETIRNFVFTWQGDYAVKAFNLALQKPSAATYLTTNPALIDTPADKNGFTYQSTQNLKLAAQETYTVQVSYQNASGTLSASTLKIQSSSSLTENVPGQVSVMTYLPWVLGILAIILIVGGLGWYWYSSRSSVDTSKSNHKRSIRKKPAESSNQDRQIYCHQCGKRALADDRFCRTCGAQLRQGNG